MFTHRKASTFARAACPNCGKDVALIWAPRTIDCEG